MPLELGWATDPGRVHPVNEDSYALFPAPAGNVLLVCDGMGGMGRGDEASQLAVRAIYQHMLAAEGTPGEMLAEALRRADYAIRRKLCSSGRVRPGATASAALVVDGKITVCWIGDSPAYWLRGSKVVYRTRDDKLVEDLVDQGEITREEAASSPLSSVLTKALGGRPPSSLRIDPSLAPDAWSLADGDCIVICSDGLTDLVTGEEVAAVTADMGPQDAAQELVRMANERGGHDNITVIVGRKGSATPLHEPASNIDISPWMEGIDEHATDPHGLAVEQDTFPPPGTDGGFDNATVELPPMRGTGTTPRGEDPDGAGWVAAATVATFLAAAVMASSML